MAKSEKKSFEELAKIISSLPEREHPNVLRIIEAEERNPGTINDCEIDPAFSIVEFHLLSTETLRALECYLEARCVNTQSEMIENNPDNPRDDKSSTSEYIGKLRSSKGVKSNAGDTKSDLKVKKEIKSKVEIKSEVQSREEAGSDAKKPKKEGVKENINARLRKRSQKSEARSNKE